MNLRGTALKTLLVIGIMATGSRIYAFKPLAGVTGLTTSSPRTMALSSLFSEHLNRILETTGLFNMVNPRMLKQELQKFNCLEEKCIIRFAQQADIRLIVSGNIEDNGEFITVTLHAYGTDDYYHGKLIYRYVAEIPMTGKYGTRELSYVSEEHSGAFISKMLKYYRLLLPLSKDEKGIYSVTSSITGRYTAYRDAQGNASDLEKPQKVGTITFLRGKVTGSSYTIKEKDFILTGFKEKAASLKKFYYQRKREIVYKKPAATDTLISILLAGPASAAMPIVSPFFGYYRNSDWLGLTLWAVSVTPYLYLEINGMTDYFQNYYKRRKTVPQDVRAQNFFAYYMLAAGGLPLFVDSLAYTFVRKAANYQGIQRFMGNPFTAAFITLISGGAGHFYKGHRLWGHLYFHVNNILVYFTIREFSPQKEYIYLTDSHTVHKINKKRAYTLLGVTCLVKVGELIHVLLINDKISSGKIIEEGHSIEPILYTGEDLKLNVGLQYSYRF